MILTVTLNPANDRYYVIDSYEPGKTIRSKENYTDAGGKGIVVSKMARLAGEEVTATGFLGGFVGDHIRHQLEGRGIVCRFVQVPDETRTCVKIADRGSKTLTELEEPGSAVTPESLEELKRVFERSLADCDVAMMGGSVQKGVGLSIYPELIAIARRCGKKVILDTSGDLLKEGVKAKPDMIKPNFDELRSLCGQNIQTVDEVIFAAEELRKGGIGLVVVSLGKDGAVAVGGEGVFRGVPPDVPVVNTVGCGDSMVAGFAAGLAKGRPLAETFRMALAMSAGNAMTKEAGYFEAEKLPELLQGSKVTKIG